MTLLIRGSNKRINKSCLSLLPSSTAKEIKGVLLDPVYKLVICMSFGSTCALLNAHNQKNKLHIMHKTNMYL